MGVGASSSCGRSERRLSLSDIQFALSTRAGADCVVHANLKVTDLDPRMTVLSIDGIGANRARLSLCRALRGLLPFVCSRKSCHQLIDEGGQRRQKRQKEEGGQRDSLMELRFISAVCSALTEVQAELLPDIFCSCPLSGPEILRTIRTIWASMIANNLPTATTGNS